MLAPAAPLVLDVLRVLIKGLGTQKTGSLRQGAILRGIDLEDFCQVNHEAVGRRDQEIRKAAQLPERIQDNQPLQSSDSISAVL